MSYAWSRLMSTATASYGVYALVEPRHLGRAMTDNEPEQASYDLVAQTYAARDLPVSALAVLGRSGRTVTAAMLARIAFDVADGVIMSRRAEDEETRKKVLAVTMGWAALNTVALLRDRRAERLARRP